jgi:dTDP-4-amino-4,6-dideoxygalactose transaminase
MSNLAILGGEKVRTKPFSPWPLYSENDKSRLLEVLESRNWGGFPFPNRFASEFAQKFADYHGAKYGCTLVNGTVALTVALRAAGVKFGAEVIVPAYTWDGTATAVLDAGCVPVFADIDPDTYCLDIEDVRRRITPRTRAVMPVHLAMRFAEMDALLDLARERDLIVIEDCAHVHGGFYNGRGAGSMGDVGSFSMQSSKLMTSGEGGVVITSRLDCYEMIQSLVNCGRASETDQFGKRPTGCNYRVTEFQAAVLLGQLERLPELTGRRAMNAKRLSEALTQIPGIRPLPPQRALTTEAIYCYVFQYRPGEAGEAKIGRDMFVAALDAEGIPSDGRFYEPVYRSDLFHASADDFPQLRLDRAEPVDYSKFSCPVAERAAYQEAVWLPQFVLLGDESDVDDVARAVAKVARNLAELENADPQLAAIKSMSRAERPRIEKKNY